MTERIIRGSVLAPLEDQHAFTLLADALIVIDNDGKISEVSTDPDRLAEHDITRPGAVWMPGFVDTHIHFPQTMILGSASGPLLPWLQKSVFPEESKFVDAAYAQAIAKVFCQKMLAQGTTCASIFSSSHPGATDVLFETMHDVGMRGDVGLTLMNRGAPEALLLDTEEAIAACEELVEKWHGADRDRLRFRVTPRFALSCTQDLLEAAGALAARHDLPIQTHISENPDEITATAEAFPDAEDYLGVYEDAGLLRKESLFAHGVWLKDREWDAIARIDAAISHCPDSNFFLASGPMPLKEVKSRDIRMGMGSDIGAGRTFSLRKCCSRGFDASRLTDSETDAAELLWYATRGGAVALGRGEQIGLIETGYDADLVAIRPVRWTEDAGEMCDLLVYLEDHDGVEETCVRGNTLYQVD